MDQLVNECACGNRTLYHMCVVCTVMRDSIRKKTRRMGKTNAKLYKGEEYLEITYDEAKKKGYIGSEHMEKQPDGTFAFHIQSGSYWTLEDN